MVDTVKILGALLGNGAVSKGSAGNVLGNVLGAALGGNQQSSSGGLGDLLGGLLGGGQQQQQRQSGGGLGDLVGSVLGGGNQQRQQQSGGGAADILGSLLGGGQSKSGDLGGLGGLLGAAVSKYAQSQNPSAPAAKKVNWKKQLPTGMKKQEANGQAKLMIQAMINAAKSDGTIDDAEQQKIVGKLGDISQDEIDFVRAEFAKPLDTNGFAHSVPSHLAQKVYAVSLLGIDLDTNQEAQYLHELAQCMHVEPEVANKIHEQLGAPKLYA